MNDRQDLKLDGSKSPGETTTTSISSQPLKFKVRWYQVLLALPILWLLAELIFLAIIWPDWAALHQGKVPESALMKDYRRQRIEDPKLPPLQWYPLQKSLPNNIKKAFILSEDSRFYEHNGVDFQAIQDAMEYNWKHRKILLGASTISQQTAKNMFLSLSRNPLRKFHELLLTWLLESRLSKAEILHIYLNIAEFGKGIYGIEAAARTYYHDSAYHLSPGQAAELAATLPSPKKHNPRTRTRFFQNHVARLNRTLQTVDQYAAQQAKPNAADSPEVSAELARKLQELRELNANDPDAAMDSSSPPPTVSAVPSETSDQSAPDTASSTVLDKPADDIPEASQAVSEPVEEPEPTEQPKILE